VNNTESSSSTAGPGFIVAGRYRLSLELGRGSTGVVWDARDLTTDEPVALKVLHTALLASPAARIRFQREMAIAGALEHPHSVRVKSHGQTAEGNEYLVMERLDGQTLRALLASTGPLPQIRAIRIIAQILDAVAAAHRDNIIHRDLKPGNVILLETAGEPDFVKVCDFGLAKVFTPDAAEDENEQAHQAFTSMATGQGDLCGTPDYMAPEQARGEVLDGRADLYSVAVMLFQAVVGKLPFQGKTPLAVLSQHLATPPTRPGVLRPDLGIATALENLILRGLAKDRRERPSSAEVFRAELLQIERDLLREARRQARRSGAATESATLPAAPARSPSRPGKAGIVVLAAVLGAVVFVGGAWILSRKPESPVLPAAPVQREAFVPTEKSDLRVPVPTVSNPSVPGAASVAVSVAAPVAALRPVIKRQAPAARPSLPVVAPPPAVLNAPAADRQSPIETVPIQPQTTAGPAASIQRAEDLLAGGQGTEACALGETIAAAHPGLEAVHGFLGRCYMRIGQRAKARASYRRYLELAPDAQDARFVRAIVEGKP
jgi:serine/threonine-protein kinase